VVGDNSYGGSEDGFARYTSLVRGLKKKKIRNPRQSPVITK